MILLDTSVLIDLPKLDLPEEDVAFSVISYGELLFGVEVARDAASKTLRQQRLALLNTLGPQWLPFDNAAAAAYGRLAGIAWRKRPSLARGKDIMIAAHAFSIGAKLATLNPADFATISTEVEILVPIKRPSEDNAD